MGLILHPSGQIDGIDTDSFKSSLPSGHIIQFIRGTTSQINGRHSESAGNWESTGCSISITPKLSTSLIIVEGFLNVYSDAGNTQGIKIYNGTSYSTKWITYSANLGSGPWIHQNFHYEQTAGTTSQLTFIVYHSRVQGSGNAYCGWESSPGATGNGQGIHVMEVTA
tara:strand:- start:278 stop:778 length:501 start_codon:yes stop_codon:yes gene_type:complete